MTVETSGFCHSERSEESVMNVTMTEGCFRMIEGVECLI